MFLVLVKLVEKPRVICTFSLSWLCPYMTFTSHAPVRVSPFLFLHRTLALISAFYAWNGVTFVVWTCVILLVHVLRIRTVISNQCTLSSSCNFPVRLYHPAHKTLFDRITYRRQWSHQKRIVWIEHRCYVCLNVVISSDVLRVSPFEPLQY